MSPIDKRVDRIRRRMRGEKFCPHCGESLESEFSKVKSKEDLEKLFAKKCEERGIILSKSEHRADKNDT